MGGPAAKLNDEEFFYSNLAEHEDGTLSGADLKRFDEIVEKRKLGQKITDFGIIRGQLQLDFQKVFVDEHLNHQLHVLVEDDATRANHEATDIDEFERGAFLGRFIRGTVIITIMALVVGFGYYFLAPKQKAKFSALDSLVYEAAVMIEDPEGRLDFPTDDLDELRDYFSRYPDLGFDVKSVKSPGKGWRLDGGTVIDYEVQKIIAAQFAHRQGDKLFVYLFEGTLDDFPYSEPGNLNGLLYQTYASDYFNVVVWEINEDVVGMVVGSRKVEDLAQAAFSSIGI